MSFELTCEWIETCERPSVGMAAHPIHGVIPVCGNCQSNFRVQIIAARTEVS